MLALIFQKPMLTFGVGAVLYWQVGAKRTLYQGCLDETNRILCKLLVSTDTLILFSMRLGALGTCYCMLCCVCICDCVQNHVCLFVISEADLGGRQA